MNTLIKHNFINMEISKADKDTYQDFVNLIFESLLFFINEQRFNHDPQIFITILEKVLRNNLFEDFIQKNADLIESVVSGRFTFDDSIDIHCTIVKNFVNWFKMSTSESQKLILKNIIYKLSTIDIKEENPEIPD